MIINNKPYLIFDFDGTLADTLAPSIQIYNDFATKNKLQTIRTEDIPKLKNQGLRQVLKDLKLSKFNLIKLLKNSHKEFSNHLDEIQLFPQIPKLLQDLKAANFKLGILSSNSVENIQTILKKANLLDHFDFVESSSNLFGKAKSLKKLLTKHNLNPKNIIYIGDEVRDIEAAQQAKIKSMAVTWGWNSAGILQKSKPSYLIQDPSEFIDCLST